MSNYHLKQLINGEWVDAQHGTTWELVNPATETVIQEIPFGDASDATAAIDAAHTAFKTWSRTTPYQRADVLMKAAQWILERDKELASITTEESGKPFGESLGEWRSAANYLIWNAEEAKRAYGRTIPARVASRRISVQKVPMGVVGTITAWNFPIYNVVRCWSAALAAGCTVVGRPSEFTPRTAMLLAQALHESGAPNGVINCINGDPEAMAQVMLADPRCRKISFTGSTRVGKLLMDGASQTVTRLALEMGGNAPVLVFSDVDVERVAKESVQWKYRNAGQVCVAPQRFYVHEAILDHYLERVTELSQALVVGNGTAKETQVGPLINARQRDRVADMVQQSVGLGATVLAGGQRPDGAGYFYQPTVVTDLTPTMPLHNEEIFGPVMPVIPFSDTEEVIEWANASDYGLTAFVMTNDLNTSIKVTEALEYGMICLNDWLPATPEAPFSGVKQSGVGVECGLEGLEDYLEIKTIFTGNVQ